MFCFQAPMRLTGRMPFFPRTLDEASQIRIPSPQRFKMTGQVGPTNDRGLNWHIHCRIYNYIYTHYYILLLLIFFSVLYVYIYIILWLYDDVFLVLVLFLLYYIYNSNNISTVINIYTVHDGDRSSAGDGGSQHHGRRWGDLEPLSHAPWGAVELYFFQHL